MNLFQVCAPPPGARVGDRAGPSRVYGTPSPLLLRNLCPYIGVWAMLRLSTPVIPLRKNPRIKNSAKKIRDFCIRINYLGK